MRQSLSAVRADLGDRYGRFAYLNAVLMRLPGSFGVTVRSRIIPRYFGAAGERVEIHEGVRFRNIHRLFVGDDVAIGIDNFFQAGGDIRIGNSVMLGPGVKIWSVNHVFEDPDRPIREQGYDEAPVTIGDHCWLGANVFVMPGVTLPEGCVVSACSVVGARLYRPYSIIAGSPARVIGNRRSETGPGPAPVTADELTTLVP